VLPYPAGGTKYLLRAPLLLYRLGLGSLLNVFRLVVLTTQGRKSGLPRHTVVEYRMHGTKVYVISAWGERPHWVQNLLAHPHATLQAGSRTYGATAHPVTDNSEILRALFLFRKRAPALYDAIIARLTDAESVDARSLPDLAEQFTVMRFDLCQGDPMPGLKRDLTWVWGVWALSLAGLLALLVMRRRQS
jgi:deazaflavin-dependent oxidoreductase (nitroreductase family)